VTLVEIKLLKTAVFLIDPLISVTYWLIVIAIFIAILSNIAYLIDHNLMNINVAKTKEMLIGRINKEPPPNIFMCNNVIERVSSFRLLGVHYVLPPCRDTNIIAKLRSASVYATPTVRTNRFKKSFIMYALNNY